jgi:hypothetical protein
MPSPAQWRSPGIPARELSLFSLAKYYGRKPLPLNIEGFFFAVFIPVCFSPKNQSQVDVKMGLNYSKKR